MELIKPKEISGKIMTLIEEADSKVIIVSPYYNIGKWYKLLGTLNELKRRNVEVEFYVRENEYESIREVERAGFYPNRIPNLHTKLYLNERYGIVSSMNLNQSSDSNSLDIAMCTQTKDEYDDLVQYYERYLKRTAFPNTSVKVDPIATAPTSVEVTSSSCEQPTLTFTQKLLKLLKQDYSFCVFEYNEYSDTILCKDWNMFFDLHIVPKGSYYRIDFRLSAKEYKLKSKYFNLLRERRTEIDIVFPGDIVNFGSEMKRIKFDFPINSSELENLDEQVYLEWIKKADKVLMEVLKGSLITSM